jgi:hypothetical protein
MTRAEVTIIGPGTATRQGRDVDRAKKQRSIPVSSAGRMKRFGDIESNKPQRPLAGAPSHDMLPA